MGIYKYEKAFLAVRVYRTGRVGRFYVFLAKNYNIIIG